MTPPNPNNTNPPANGRAGGVNNGGATNTETKKELNKVILKTTLNGFRTN